MARECSELCGCLWLLVAAFFYSWLVVGARLAIVLVGVVHSFLLRAARSGSIRVLARSRMSITSTKRLLALVDQVLTPHQHRLVVVRYGDDLLVVFGNVRSGNKIVGLKLMLIVGPLVVALF
jgi:hypothetical protein